MGKFAQQHFRRNPRNRAAGGRIVPHAVIGQPSVAGAFDKRHSAHLFAGPVRPGARSYIAITDAALFRILEPGKGV